MIDGLFGGFESWTDAGGAAASSTSQRHGRTFHQMTSRGFRMFWPLLFLLYPRMTS